MSVHGYHANRHYTTQSDEDDHEWDDLLTVILYLLMDYPLVIKM